MEGLRPGALAGLRGAPVDEIARLIAVLPSDVVTDTAVTALRVATDSLPVARGAFEVDGEGVCFVPRFPFLARTPITVLVAAALVGDPADGPAIRLDTVVPGELEDPSTEVVEIFPTSVAVPRNLLRLYVAFSSRMTEGAVEACVRITRADTGESIDDAFLPMDPELWDPERRRVTVLFDPARIKRGLVPHRESGYPLEQGVPIVVTVDAAFVDAGGRALRAPASRRYVVGPDVRQRVDPALWTVRAPRAGTRLPVAVEFDRPLDAALLAHCLTVRDHTGVMRGRVRVCPGEQRWEFYPDRPWYPTTNHVVVAPILEDQAGNSVSRVFDRELADPAQAPVPATPVTLAFVTT